MTNAQMCWVALGAWVSVACLEVPSLVGRTCSDEDPCPGMLVCVQDRCAETAEDGGIAEDAGIADGTDGAMDALDGAVADVDGGDPVSARCADPVAYPEIGWQARFFGLESGATFGACVGVEDLAEDSLDIDWGNGAPVPGGPIDFGSRLTARRTFEAGAVTFRLRFDDGLRLFIDDALVYEEWTPGAQAVTFVTTPYLSAGPHDLRIEHFDSDGAAVIDASWTRGCTAALDNEVVGDDWLVSYHRMGAGQEIVVDECFGWERRTGPDFDVGWMNSAPAPVAEAGVVDDWALVARGVRDFDGQTTFTLASDDGYRIFFDGVEAAGRWNDGGADLIFFDDYLPSPVNVVLEKYDRTGIAALTFIALRDCDVVPPGLTDTQWFAAYYAVSGDRVDGYALDRSICLGAEVIDGEQLVWTVSPTIPVALRPGGLWGAEYLGTRTFASPTTAGLIYDDGLRIYRDPMLLYEDWTAPNVVTDGQVSLPAGTYLLRLEYFQEFGGSQVRFTWP